MKAQMKHYQRETDYEAVSQFLIDTYIPGGNYVNWLQPRREYMHWHPILETTHLDRIGVWWDDGKVAAVVNYEDRLGAAYFHTHPDYDTAEMKNAMLTHAEEHLTGVDDKGNPRLLLFIHELDHRMNEAAKARGYAPHEKGWTEHISIMEMPDPFPAVSLPEGFRLASLADENDLVKLDRCLWRGFNHPGEPEGGVEGRILMQSTPNYNKKLNLIAIAPNGDYVSYSGIWYDAANRIGYVEPVATDPDYRRMGLGRACVMECVRRVGALGAEVVFVESDLAFYHSLGFRLVHRRPVWTKGGK